MQKALGTTDTSCWGGEHGNGVMITEVTDPYHTRFVKHFELIPEDSFFKGVPGPRNAMTEDVVVDERGYIYVNCFDDGFYVLKRTGNLANR